jgi:cell division protein FtsA
VILTKNFQVHYTTAVGLVMNSIENKTQSAVRKDEISQKCGSAPVDEYQERKQEEAEEVGNK